MGAPGGSTLAKLARKQFASHSLVLPAPFSLDMGHPHFVRAFRPAELGVSPASLGPSAAGFLSLAPNAYFVCVQKSKSKEHYAYLDGICKAIACAWTDWCKTAVLKSVQVNGKVASGGEATGPNWEPIIKLRGPHDTLMSSLYTEGIASAVGTAWERWAQSLRVPTLSWYPTFQEFPAPFAPPTENVPCALTALAQDPTPLTHVVLATSIADALFPRVGLTAVTSVASGGGVGGLVGPIAPHHQAIADAIAFALDTCFEKWRAATQVTKVFGKGPVPLYAPPNVPKAPVTGGTAEMLPGGFDTATFDPSSVTEQIKDHESFVAQVYADPLTGMADPTIGYGSNLGQQWVRNAFQSIGVDPAALLAGTRTVTAAEATQVLDVGVGVAVGDARGLFTNFDSLAPEKQGVLVNMAYNLGRDRLGKFTKLIDAVKRNDWKSAAAEMRNSNWYNQTGHRAAELTRIMAEDPCG